MIAGKQLDIIMGVDIHIVNIPSPAGPVPTPMPHPHIGILMDPMEYLPIVGTSVFVNGLPAAYAGAAGIAAPPHIPMGAGFTRPVDNENEIFMGSATVLCCDQPMSSLGHMALSCSCIGAPPPPRPGKDPGSGLMLPTSVFLAIPGGMLVMVGGPPTVSMLGLIFSFAKVGFGWLKKTKAMKKSSDKIHQAASKATKKLPENARNKVHRSICDFTGHPVDIPTGKVFTDHVDFELAGPIPLKFERAWYSTSNYQGPLGSGWHHSFDFWVKDSSQDQAYQIRLADGRNLYVPYLEKGDVHWNKQEKIRLEHTGDALILRTKDRKSYLFLIKDLDEGKKAPLRSIFDANDNAIEFFYEGNGTLSRIHDSAGRDILFDCSETGRIERIHLPNPSKQGEHYTHLQYVYSADGNLVEVIDYDKKSFNYYYQGSLLVREVNRNGLSFYFEYDGIGQDARCVRTWGDEGIYERHLHYDDDRSCTIVENSLGISTEFFWNDLGLVYKTVGPEGRINIKRYGEFVQLLSQTDPKGRTTRFEYSEEGDIIQVLYPDQSSVAISYDDHLPTSMVDQNEGTICWSYDEKGRLVSKIDQEGNETQYAFEGGLLTKITHANGALSFLDYDEHKNLISIKESANNSSHSWQYDFQGNPVLSTDPAGNKSKFKYDRLGRLIKAHEPDGNIRNYEYDAEGNVIFYSDRQFTARMRYSGLNKLAMREQAGTRIMFEYDTEEQLNAIVNEAGKRYTFSRNLAGEVIEEQGFDGLKREYERDLAGIIQKEYLNNGKIVCYEFDELDRILKVECEGETEEYSYRADGVLISARNAHAEIEFERDALGRIVAEKNGAFVVRSKYDPFGNRVELETALGEQVNLIRDAQGRLNRISVGKDDNRWAADYKRDVFGLEVEALLPGNVRNQWHRDKLGRASSHEVSTGGRPEHIKKYSWGVNQRLNEITNEKGETTNFNYDELGYLSGVKYADGAEELRVADIVGNLYKTEQKNDRRYGPGGELLESSGTSFDYDLLGNLRKKVTKAGEVWEFQWYNNGYLKKVVRPDGEPVSFTYDALGRRLTKKYRSKLTRWIWDGNHILHEWEEQQRYSTSSENDIWGENSKAEDAPDHPVEINVDPASIRRGNESTWLFDESGFSPIALLKQGEEFSIINDHLGTPCKMYNEKGEEVWSMELSIYGEVKALKGQRDDCPFRYPGQYEDEETGLYYNRFRYYSPETGGYISQDPIGLAGGAINLYQYVWDPNSLVDRLGLAGTPIVVIGEGQLGVDAATSALRDAGYNAESMMNPRPQWKGGRLYEGMPEADFQNAVDWNKQWLKDKIDEGYKVVDIGSDGREVRSRFYQAELDALKETKTHSIKLKKLPNGESIGDMRKRLSCG